LTIGSNRGALSSQIQIDHGACCNAAARRVYVRR
jgi:hypothetical protein